MRGRSFRPKDEQSSGGSGAGGERDFHGEREAAEQTLKRARRRRATVGADKGYDARAFVDAARTLDVTPHVAQEHVQALERDR